MFPFWIAVKPDGQPVVAPQTNYVLAFTTLQGAKEYLQGIGESQWECRLVSRANVRKKMARSRESGSLGVCLDSSGERVTWDEIEAAL